MKYFIICLTICLCSCLGAGYSFKGGTIPGATFSYNNFPNNATIVYPNLSNEFQDQLRKKVLSESNLSFEDKRGDANFDGTITHYKVSAIQGAGNNIAQRNRLTISVKVVYTNSAKVDAGFDKTYTDYEDFDSSVSFDSEEEELVKLIVEKLVIKIYNDILIGF